jgi:hypothetical protein
MASNFVYRIKVTNDSAGPIQLWIEPWAEEFIVEPATELSVEFDGPQQGEVVANYVQGGLQLYGFSRSSALVKKAGAVIWKAHERLQM